MNFYDFEEIARAGCCVTFCETVLNLQADRNGRFQAVWRGGDGYNVAVSREEWYDHKSKAGGGLIELCAISQHNGDKQAAQNFLGEWLRLEPKFGIAKQPTHSARLDELLADGYREVKRYGYEDLEGNLVHFVARFEHPEKEKEFMQGTPRGWGLRDVAPILYRMADWIGCSFVYICEGEKDVDLMIDQYNLPATTNCGGSEKWRPEYAQHFKGKNVVIIQDNDEAGQKHAMRVARELKHAAKRIIVIKPSALEKGDIHDWFTKENGTVQQLTEMVRMTPEMRPEDLEEIDPVVEAAKAANKKDFANYTEHQEKIGNQSKTVRTARLINDLIEEVHTRFCGFPRRVGNSRTMFDHDRSTGRIVYLHDHSELFAWIGRKSGRRVKWAIGDSMVTKQEIFKGLLAESQVYEAISTVPDWPRRTDVYYVYPALPPASEGFEYFQKFVDFFEPANEAYRTLLKAFICAPLWYVNGVPRPGWIIDSEDGAGTGKTTMVELVAKLYSSSAIRTNRQQLKTDVERLTRRILSSEGRHARILLMDNVTGDFHCSELADLMTAESITGMVPYGRGEETRPNNLTYVITANSATVDNDLSDRCFYVQVKRPKRSLNWKVDVLQFIEKHRMQIIADIIGMLEQAPPMPEAPRTRFPNFEAIILYGICKDQDEYEAAMEVLQESKSASNIEDEHAKTIEDEFRSRLIDAGFQPGREDIFIRTDVAKLWLQEILSDEAPAYPMQYLRNLAKNGLTKRLCAKPDRYPREEHLRKRGIMWKADSEEGFATRILGLNNRKVVEIITS